MGSIRIGLGTEWLVDGRSFRVVRQTGPGSFVARDERFQTEQTFSCDEVLALYASGELRFAAVGGESNEAESTPVRPCALTDLPLADQQEVARRWDAIEPLTQLKSKPLRADYRARADVITGTNAAYSARSLARFYAAWSEAGGDRTALLRKTSRCGSRGRDRTAGLLGQYPEIRKLTDDAITSLYLTTARRPMSAVSRRVLEEIQRRNARLPAGKAIPVPRFGALQRAISRRIARLDPWEVDRARWGRRIADRRHAPTSRQQLAARILERVEFDHSPLKIVVGNQAGPLGQPWLTVMIDYYSRMITGFCLGFEPPSYGVIMEALRTAILPKSATRERYPNIRNDWPCFGIPDLLVCDRGSDLTSKDLEQAAFQLGITLDFAPPRTPHFKGTVESFFDTLNDELLASLPGRTFRSWERRADYQPDDGPLMPYETLLEIVHIHLIDVYSQSRHPTIGRTRLEVWQESAAEFPPCLPASPDDLVVLLSKHVERSLSARGIEISGMFYQSDELMALRAEIAANNLGADHLQVRYNPWDLGQIWVLNPIDRRYLRAASVDAAMRGMTEYQWRVLKRAIRERFDEPDHLLSLAASRNTIRDLVEAALNKPSRQRRVRAARFLQGSSNPAAARSAPDAEWSDATQVTESGQSVADPDPIPSAEEDATAPIPASGEPQATPSSGLPEPDLEDWEIAGF